MDSDPWIVVSGCSMNLAPVGEAVACQLAIGIGVLGHVDRNVFGGYNLSITT